jgi:enoyl-CoA hydratase
MSLIDVAVKDRVAMVTLVDPANRNAMSWPMVVELVGSINELESNADVGAIVVTGAPPAFCSGANLSGGPDKVDIRAFYEGFLRLGRSTLPTIAAVNGAAVGAGMNLALCCDVRLVGDQARFITRFVELGMHPGGGHTWMLQRAVGYQGAAAALLFGQSIGPQAAVSCGLAFRHVPDHDLLQVAHDMGAIAAGAAVELTSELKKTMQATACMPTLDEAVILEVEKQQWSLEQPFFRERLRAMRQKIRSTTSTVPDGTKEDR